MEWLPDLPSQRLMYQTSEHSGSNWNLEVLVFRKWENRSPRRKTSRSRKENKRQTRPTWNAESGNRTPDHIGGGRRGSALTTAPSLLPGNTKFPLTYIVCEVYTISASRAWSSSVWLTSLWRQSVTGHCLLSLIVFVQWLILKEGQFSAWAETLVLQYRPSFLEKKSQQCPPLSLPRTRSNTEMLFTFSLNRIESIRSTSPSVMTGSFAFPLGESESHLHHTQSETQ